MRTLGLRLRPGDWVHVCVVGDPLPIGYCRQVTAVSADGWVSLEGDEGDRAYRVDGSRPDRPQSLLRPCNGRACHSRHVAERLASAN